MAVDLVMMIVSARRLMAVMFIVGGFVMQLASLFGDHSDSDTDTDMFFTGAALSAFGVFYNFI